MKLFFFCVSECVRCVCRVHRMYVEAFVIVTFSYRCMHDAELKRQNEMKEIHGKRAKKDRMEEWKTEKHHYE